MEHVRGVAAHDLFLILARQAGQLGMHVFLRLESNGANVRKVRASENPVRPDQRNHRRSVRIIDHAVVDARFHVVARPHLQIA